MFSFLAFEPDAQRLFKRVANGRQRPQRSLGLHSRERVAGVRSEEPGNVLRFAKRNALCVSARRRYSPKLLPKALAELCAVLATSQNASSVVAS